MMGNGQWAIGHGEWAKRETRNAKRETRGARCEVRGVDAHRSLRTQKIVSAATSAPHGAWANPGAHGSMTRRAAAERAAPAAAGLARAAHLSDEPAGVEFADATGAGAGRAGTAVAMLECARARATLNKSPRGGALCLWDELQGANHTSHAQRHSPAMARICNAADHQKTERAVREGLVQRCPRVPAMHKTSLLRRDFKPRGLPARPALTTLVTFAALAAGTLSGCGTAPAPITRAPPATVAVPVAPPPKLAPTLAQERQRLAELFKGTPVVLAIDADGSFRAEVPLKFCFDAGKSVVKPPLAALLDRLAKSPATQRSAWTIAAPADAKSKGFSLAGERAASARDYLVAHGANAARFTISAVGSAESGAMVKIVVTAS